MFHYRLSPKAWERLEPTGAGRPGRYLVAMCRKWFRRLKRGIVVMRLRSRVVPVWCSGPAIFAVRESRSNLLII